jgi:hypothetical protein
MVICLHSSAISEIREQDPALADVPDAWAESFEHDRILGLLGSLGQSPRDAMAN